LHLEIYETFKMVLEASGTI